MKKIIGIIGGGNMGAAIIKGIVASDEVIICEKDKKRNLSLRRKFKIQAQDLTSLVQNADVIIVAVKPQDMDGILKEVGAVVTKNKLVVSIAAGITTSFMEKRLGKGIRVIRTMPNMPAQISEGVTAICKGKYARRADVDIASRIFSRVGTTVVVKEDMIDAITAISGSGPAYVFLFVECFLKAAHSLGLKGALAEELVKSTLLGSAHLLYKQKEDAAALRFKVTSKGGTTQAAMDVFMQNKFEAVFKQAATAAKKRAKELAKK